MICSTLDPDDLNHVLDHTIGLWESLRGRRLFLTGGTGFFGTWLTETFLWANDKLHLEAQMVILSRDPRSFRARNPHLADEPALALHEGDVRTFEFPRGNFSHILHAATPSSAAVQAQDPLVLLDTIVAGTRRVLDFAVCCGARRFLLTSSGAVYGQQPADQTHVSEDYPGSVDPMDAGSAYAQGKRLAEHLGALYGRRNGIETTVARGFAFLGPHLPLDQHFAAGNFVRDALGGGPIVVQGDGTAYRSYLYAADLAIWLWTILLRGQTCRPYNVGSPVAITIAELARAVAAACQTPCEVVISRRTEPGTPPSRYVPSIERAETELDLKPWIDLPQAIDRTMRWHRRRRESTAEMESRID